jgi:hypothetical protein
MAASKRGQESRLVVPEKTAQNNLKNFSRGREIINASILIQLAGVDETR